MTERLILPHLNTEPAPGDAFFDVSTGTAYERVRDGWRVMTRQDLFDLLHIDLNAPDA